MNRLIAHSGGSRKIINRLTQNVKHTSQGLLSNRHTDGSPCGNYIHAPHQSVCGTHGNTAYNIVTQMLGNLHYKRAAASGRNFQRFVYIRQTVLFKFHVQNRADNLRDFSVFILCHCCFLSFIFTSIN